MDGTETPAETVSTETVQRMIADRVKALGGQTPAAKFWKCSLQMVNMVEHGKRRPNDAMLADIGIEKVTSEISYRRVTKGSK